MADHWCHPDSPVQLPQQDHSSYSHYTSSEITQTVRSRNSITQSLTLPSQSIPKKRILSWGLQSSQEPHTWQVSISCDSLCWCINIHDESTPTAALHASAHLLTCCLACRTASMPASVNWHSASITFRHCCNELSSMSVCWRWWIRLSTWHLRLHSSSCCTCNAIITNNQNHNSTNIHGM